MRQLYPRGSTTEEASNPNSLLSHLSVNIPPNRVKGEAQKGHFRRTHSVCLVVPLVSNRPFAHIRCACGDSSSSLKDSDEKEGYQSSRTSHISLYPHIPTANPEESTDTHRIREDVQTERAKRRSQIEHREGPRISSPRLFWAYLPWRATWNRGTRSNPF
jgi:hypothetical protein